MKKRKNVISFVTWPNESVKENNALILQVRKSPKKSVIENVMYQKDKLLELHSQQRTSFSLIRDCSIKPQVLEVDSGRKMIILSMISHFLQIELLLRSISQ